jgi:hypothetical protein
VFNKIVPGGWKFGQTFASNLQFEWSASIDQFSMCGRVCEGLRVTWCTEENGHGSFICVWGFVTLVACTTCIYRFMVTGMCMSNICTYMFKLLLYMVVVVSSCVYIKEDWF